MRKCSLQHLRRLLTKYDTELKKILGFYNNERSHNFDEDILKTQLQIFFKNFPLKEQLSIIDIENYFKGMEPSSKKLLSEVGKILELVLLLPATNATLPYCLRILVQANPSETSPFFTCPNGHADQLLSSIFSTWEEYLCI